MSNQRRSLRNSITETLKRDAEIAGTFPKYGHGTDEETVGYEVVKYTPSIGFSRGLLNVVRKDGTRLPVISAHEEGEPTNAGDYEHQRNLGIRYARQEGVGYGETDDDLASTVLRERKK